MEAIVAISGFQYRVKENYIIKAPKIDGKEGDEIKLQNVLMLIDKNKVKIGNPYLENAYIDAKILGYGRYPKIIVYKYRRRTKYRRKGGHKQDYTKLLVTGIGKEG
jgi:large subunit ribosomal protein L21